MCGGRFVPLEVMSLADLPNTAGPRMASESDEGEETVPQETSTPVVPPEASTTPDAAAENEESPMLVGRMRRWHRRREWGFIFSELHNCDVFLDGSDLDEGSPEIEEGDFVFFHVAAVDRGQFTAKRAKRATFVEVAAQQDILGPIYEQQVARTPRVPELPQSIDVASSAVPAATETAGGQQQAAPASAETSAGQQPTGVAAWNHQPQQPPQPQPQRAAMPPPPPPPSHPAPNSGSGGIPVQDGTMLPQMPYTGQQQQQQPYGYPSYQSMYPQGTWVNSDSAAVLSTAGQPQPQPGQGQLQPGQAQRQPSPHQAAQQAQPQPGVSLLMACPAALGSQLNAKDVAAMLKSGTRAERAPTFVSTRGAASSIGAEWCTLVRQGIASQEHTNEDGDGQHMQQAAGQEWASDGSPWGVWGNGQMDAAAVAQGHPHAYGGTNQLVAPMVDPSMFGMPQGDPNLFPMTIGAG